MTPSALTSSDQVTTPSHSSQALSMEEKIRKLAEISRLSPQQALKALGLLNHKQNPNTNPPKKTHFQLPQQPKPQPNLQKDFAEKESHGTITHGVSSAEKQSQVFWVDIQPTPFVGFKRSSKQTLPTKTGLRTKPTLSSSSPKKPTHKKTTSTTEVMPSAKLRPQFTMAKKAAAKKIVNTKQVHHYKTMCMPHQAQNHSHHHQSG